jgi:hypothetical protein
MIDVRSGRRHVVRFRPWRRRMRMTIGIPTDVICLPPSLESSGWCYFSGAKVITQFFSHVLPASGEKACSKRAPFGVVSE